MANKATDKWSHQLQTTVQKVPDCELIAPAGMLLWRSPGLTSGLNLCQLEQAVQVHVYLGVKHLPRTETPWVLCIICPGVPSPLKDNSFYYVKCHFLLQFVPTASDPFPGYHREESFSYWGTQHRHILTTCILPALSRGEDDPSWPAENAISLLSVPACPSWKCLFIQGTPLMWAISLHHCGTTKIIALQMHSDL